ncbi:MAG: zinc ribbon domain-containing protein [Oscillospiraceae bacterium]|nr:zinc ribbon domain-containing protein [Oscillospiraceae bacterium]
MSFFSNLRQRGCHNPHMGSGYYQQPPMSPPYPYSPAPAAPMMQCQNCQAPIVSNSKFCSSCGMKTAQNLAKQCGQCGAVIPHGSKFCSGCGTPT